ncbi:MAG: DUF6340 family protein [Bacteroidales bacterium]|nr:DUF6340 family protein [Bacteroidales bacterium]
MKKVMFSRLAAAAALVLTMSACSYYTYPVAIERKAPSVTGLDLPGKSVSVSFVSAGQKDSVFMSTLAENFAVGLETFLFDSESAIDLFAIRKTKGADYMQKDTLIQLVMSTDADVAFLFDSPEYTVDGKDTTYVRMKFYVYDSMAEVDSVYAFSGRKKYANLDKLPTETGTQFAQYFQPQWKQEEVKVYFSDDDKTQQAALFASDFQWAKAMNIWLEMVSSKNLQKRALMSYNVALACHMLGNDEMALTWLDRAESNYEVGQAKTLRARIMGVRK